MAFFSLLFFSIRSPLNASSSCHSNSRHASNSVYDIIITLFFFYVSCSTIRFLRGHAGVQRSICRIIHLLYDILRAIYYFYIISFSGRHTHTRTREHILHACTYKTMMSLLYAYTLVCYSRVYNNIAIIRGRREQKEKTKSISDRVSDDDDV